MMKSVRLAFLGALCASLALPLRAEPQAASNYHQVARIPLQGDDRWDYLTIDSEAHRLYITRATHVSVVDTTKILVAGGSGGVPCSGHCAGSVIGSALIGDIPNTQGVHGVALAPALPGRFISNFVGSPAASKALAAPTPPKAFISNGKDNCVSVIDLTTLKEITRIPVGKNPDAILFEPVSARVFAFNGHDGTATVIDARTNAVLKTIDIGGKLEFAATDGKGMIYDNVEDRNEMVVLDTNAMMVVHRWPLTGCDAPSGLAIDPASKRLFAACDNKKLAVVDSGSGKVVTTPPIGAGPDAAAFDKTTATVVTPNGEDGTLSLIHEDAPDRYTPLATVQTEIGARTMALDPIVHRIYLVTAKFGATPAPTADMPRPKPSIMPGSVVLLVYERK